MAVDPRIPDSVKKKVPDAYSVGSGVRAAVSRAFDNSPVTQAVRTGVGAAGYGLSQAGDFARGLTGTPQPDAAPVNTAVRPNVLTTPSPDAVSAGPPRPAPIDASNPRTTPPSALDANQPLPAGVRLHAGTPGSNDVIYETRGAHGERAFGNNQFNLTGSAADALSPRAVARSGEIQRNVDAQTAAANAAAGAAAIAPKNATEYNDRLKTNADIALLPQKTAAQTLANVGKAGENITNDPSTKTAEGVRLAAIASNVQPEVALQRGHQAAAQEFLDQGNDPMAPNAPPVVRAGETGVRKQLAGLLESKPRAITGGLFNEGTVVDPGATDPGDYSLGARNIFGTRQLVGPSDKSGARRAVYINDDEANQYGPYIQSRKRKQLISDRK